MRVALICHDKPGALQTRLDNRAAHLGHIQATGQVEMAGPLLDQAGQMCGSLIVLDVETFAAAEDWAAADPYAKAGLFSSVTVIEWKRGSADEPLAFQIRTKCLGLDPSTCQGG